MPHWRCIRLDLPQRRITRLIRAAKSRPPSPQGDGFYRFALCKKLGCSSQLSLPAAPDSRTQSATPWHADFNRRRACAARPKGESLLSSGRFRLSPATGRSGSTAFQFYSIDFFVTQVLCCLPCTPCATALRQARVSGGNLQNCTPSAAYGGAMTQEKNVPLSLRRCCAKEESYSPSAAALLH